MPIHDWSRVDANVFHHFHQAWAMTICHALNDNRLPAGLSAMVEQHAGGVIPDVLAIERRRAKPAKEPAGGGVVTADPQTRFQFQLGHRLAARGNRIVIKHALGTVVSVIEIVSPGNKGSRSALRGFVQKTVEFLDAGVHVLVVDLFPPTARDPKGMHKAVWDEFDEDEPFDPPAGKPLTLVSYVAAEAIRAYVESVGVGDPLPDMPAYLTNRAYVPVPLEETYRATFARCPADMRTLVETGRLPDDDES